LGFIELIVNENAQEIGSFLFPLQVFDFKRTTALLKLFISLTDEFCDYQRRKMYKHPLLKDEVDAINRDKISGAVEYRIYEVGFVR
jgi:hypothetical protein